MTKPKATTGPWKFGYTDNLEHPIIMGANGEIVCVMHEGVSTADGKLLAMAPELLEALQNLLSIAARANTLSVKDYNNAARAIAKATEGAAQQIQHELKPVDPVLQMLRDEEAKKAALIAKGICPTCKGKGECGGQFTGGEWVCEDCNGSGRAK